MRLLILGGTRFLGWRVVERLAAEGHDLTLLSRRRIMAKLNIRQICAERSVGLAMLKGSYFDLVLDFICYDRTDIDQLIGNIFMESYVLISSTWLPRLWSGSHVDELPKNPIFRSDIPQVTFNYLLGKLGAEHALVELSKTGCKAVALRLPIILGEGDRTGRLDFYLRRLVDGQPIIAVDGAQNYAQIALMEDLAEVIVCWSTRTDISRYLIWEALPGEGRRVRNILESVATAIGVRMNLIDVSVSELSRELPAYLSHEPFWRESALRLTTSNIYVDVGMVPAIFGPACAKSSLQDCSFDNLRLKELNFLATRHAN